MAHSAADARVRAWDGKSPLSIAAAIIYTITLLPQASKRVAPAEIGQVAGVAEGTVRNTYRDLYTEIASLVPAWFIDNRGNDLGQLPQPNPVTL
jgi:transcription initiation factor TFIIB